jgi:serine/threonine protein kinase
MLNPMSSHVAPGTRFAGFHVEAQIGHGAVTEVYRARDEAGHTVALKLLDAASAHDERFRQRFLRESALAAGLDHPFVVGTLDSGEDEGRPYLANRFGG